jgi:Tol biopolymer transport system component
VDIERVYVMNANGSGQRRLTRDRAFDADPAWSPDGRKIAFVSNRDGSYGVQVQSGFAGPPTGKISIFTSRLWAAFS